MQKIAVYVDARTQHVHDMILQCLADTEEFEAIHDSPFQAQLLIREVGARIEEAVAELSELMAHNPDLEIMLTSAASDPATLLCCMDAGIRYFLPQPLHPGDIRLALKRYLDRHPQMAALPGKNALVIGVLGAKGGVGTTTLAVNLALAYQQNMDEGSVLVLDANIPHGDAGIFLDIVPQLDLATIVADLARLDEVLLKSAMASHESGLRYLATVRQYEDLPLSTPESMSHVIELARSMFEVVVIDLGTYYGRVTMKVLELADSLLLVTEPTLSSLNNAASFTGHITNTYPELAEKILVVLNRFHSRAPYSIDEMEKALGRSFFKHLPNDYQTAGTAKELGKPVVLSAPKCRLAGAIRDLAQALMPMPGSGRKKRASLASRLFRRG